MYRRAISDDQQVQSAKVDNAATTGTTGLKWFKVAHDGLSNGKWAVDTMIANAGWHYFTMPTCITPGDYLMRVELIALHGAQNQGTMHPFTYTSFLS
jgi:cellulase